MAFDWKNVIDGVAHKASRFNVRVLGIRVSVGAALRYSHLLNAYIQTLPVAMVFVYELRYQTI